MNGSLKREHIEAAIERLSSAPTAMHEIRIYCNENTPEELARLDQYRGQHHDCWYKLWEVFKHLICNGHTFESIELSHPSIVRVNEESG